mmetsp:Transcript_23177/g.58437  ORF Transcript_23177/g.58437 Transcript_23177/m.58437 type:complete len:525 (-) Transcript_23177:2389-3963(-)
MRGYYLFSPFLLGDLPARKEWLQPCCLRLVVEHGRQPALSLLDGHALALRVGVDLILGDLADRKVLRALAAKVQATDSSGREHGHGLRQRHADLLLNLHQVPHGLLLSVVRLRRVARRRTDALVLDLQQVIWAQVLIRRVAPQILPDVQVQNLGKCLRQAVRDRLGHDVAVIVTLGLEVRGDRIQAEACIGEGTDVVLLAALRRRDEVSHREVLLLVISLCLLAQAIERARGLRTGLILENLDVLTDRVGRVQANDALQAQLLVVNEVLQHCLSLLKELLGLHADIGVVENLRVAAVGVPATQLPDLEEGVPVNVREYLLQRVIIIDLGANELGGNRLVLRRAPVHHRLLGRSLLEGQVLAILQASVELVAHLGVLLGHVVDVLLTMRGVEQALAHRDTARGVQHIDGRAAVHRVNLDCRVHLRGGSTANQDGNLHARRLHLLAHCDHLIQRWGDKAREAQNVRLVLLAGLNDLLPRSHDTHVNDLEVVASQHDGHNVLADVVHIALHSGNDNHAGVGVLAGVT